MYIDSGRLYMTNDVLNRPAKGLDTHSTRKNGRRLKNARHHIF